MSIERDEWGGDICPYNGEERRAAYAARNRGERVGNEKDWENY